MQVYINKLKANNLFALSSLFYFWKQLGIELLKLTALNRIIQTCDKN